jgi:phospholipid-translocating ATPase
MASHTQGGDQGDNQGKRPKSRPTHPSHPSRTRWATRKLTIKSSKAKRLSLLGRNKHHKTNSTEKKRASAGSESLRQPEQEPEEENDQEEESEEDGPGPRTLYFNLPLPDDLRDEDGGQSQQFTRNKIRTAKYTPISFIPKNLYYQFQNVANIFFLFIDILVVSYHQAWETLHTDSF